MPKQKSPRIGVGLKPRYDKSGIPKPRWEPWPAARKIGIKGRDLKDLNNAWLDIGNAINAAEDRTKWTRAILKALSGDKRVQKSLDEALIILPVPETLEAQIRQNLCRDIFDLAFALSAASWGSGDLKAIDTPKEITNPALVPPAARTIANMLRLWLKDKDGPKSRSPNTFSQYEYNVERIIADIGNLNVMQVTPHEAKHWSNIWIEKRSLGMAHHFVAVMSGASKWAKWQKWLHNNPWSGLNLPKPEGRLVIWQP